MSSLYRKLSFDESGRAAFPGGIVYMSLENKDDEPTLTTLQMGGYSGNIVFYLKAADLRKLARTLDFFCEALDRRDAK